MHWAKRRRQWAIDQCVADWGDVHVVDKAFPDDVIAHWLRLNSHKYRTDYDQTPITKNQEKKFVEDVLRIVPMPSDEEIDNSMMRENL
jgi:hypothetical protein